MEHPRETRQMAFTMIKPSAAAPLPQAWQDSYESLISPSSSILYEPPRTGSVYRPSPCAHRFFRGPSSSTLVGVGCRRGISIQGAILRRPSTGPSTVTSRAGLQRQVRQRWPTIARGHSVSRSNRVQRGSSSEYVQRLPISAAPGPAPETPIYWQNEAAGHYAWPVSAS